MDRKLTIVFFDAGGGHRSAAEALQGVLESQARPWEVELLNLQELLDQLDVLKKITGIRIQDGYNLILRRGWTRMTPHLLPLLQSAVRIYHRPTLKLLAKYWKQNPADIVISVIPHFNRVLMESIQRSIPLSAFATILTDFADYPPHFWIERESQYLICGTERAEQQAFDDGHDREHVFLASGMVMKQNFYAKVSVDRVTERRRLGLDSGTPTGIVLFGGHGSKTMLEIVKRLDASRAKLQLILICGKNQKLLHAIQSLGTRFPLFAEGFTQKVDYYMALSDFFIGKPGPGSISEALQFHLPVIVECNAATLPQERYNAQWVTEKKMGIVLKSFRHIGAGVERLLEPLTFGELRANACQFKNNALYEIPEFLEAIYERKEHPLSGLRSPAGKMSILQQAAWTTLASQLTGSLR
jgi:Glycosyltransferase family 28 C-terminal domain/Monogalactosyldiacylglycerol (MGDG) synthase